VTWTIGEHKQLEWNYMLAIHIQKGLDITIWILGVNLLQKKFKFAYTATDPCSIPRNWSHLQTVATTDWKKSKEASQGRASRPWSIHLWVQVEAQVIQTGATPAMSHSHASQLGTEAAEDSGVY
jgi:hypothetical protein